jgi:hypothetical protein
MFHEIPCRSSLIPLDVRKQIADFPDIEEFTTCQEACPIIANETRQIQQLSNVGEKEIVDELPPNEFSMNERLPPLKPSAGRHVVDVSFC